MHFGPNELNLKTKLTIGMSRSINIADFFFSSFHKVAQGQAGVCERVVCPRGRVCVAHTEDSGKNYSTCECKTTCPVDDSAPVCSYYNLQFGSVCEMHRFDYNCMEAAQFPGRYLEWIMIAREQSLDPGYSLNLSARADSLTEEERKEILSWEFGYIDANSNKILDKIEIDRLYKDILDHEPCVYGFLESCDQDGQEGITPLEWDSCFPQTL
ncbi:SPARC, partial [Acropora cervicornis]